MAAHKCLHTIFDKFTICFIELVCETLDMRSRWRKGLKTMRSLGCKIVPKGMNTPLTTSRRVSRKALKKANHMYESASRHIISKVSKLVEGKSLEDNVIFEIMYEITK